jgi:hypothetical protein
MIFALPEQAQNFNLDAVWVIIGVAFLCYVIWMIWMSISN